MAQLIPLAVLLAGLLTVLAHAARPSGSTVRALRAAMAASVAAGAAGMALHYKGNVEFEREMYPTMAGVELVAKVVTGATPLLAPGAMALLGVIGLLYTYRHPALASVPEPRKETS